MTETFFFIKFFTFLDFLLYIVVFARSCPSSFFILVLNSFLKVWIVNTFGSFWCRSISVGPKHFNLLLTYTPIIGFQQWFPDNAAHFMQLF